MEAKIGDWIELTDVGPDYLEAFNLTLGQRLRVVWCYGSAVGASRIEGGASLSPIFLHKEYTIVDGPHKDDGAWALEGLL